MIAYRVKQADTAKILREFNYLARLPESRILTDAMDDERIADMTLLAAELDARGVPHAEVE